MGVTLGKKKKENGDTLFYINVSIGSKRFKEYVPGLKLVKERSLADRRNNKETLALAKQIVHNRMQELSANDYNIQLAKYQKMLVMDFFNEYLKTYNKKDLRNMQGVIKRFDAFLQNQKLTLLTLRRLDEDIVMRFADFLKDSSRGEGAASYFARFKKILKQAVRRKLINSNPAEHVFVKREDSFAKDVLTIDEMQLLASTKITNQELANAFLFSCLTGLRWSDIVDLQWKHIDISNQLISKAQNKTSGVVRINLNPNALQLLPPAGKALDCVFKLPSHTGAAKALKKWVEKAGIQKHITWHCARHSFATNLLFYDSDILVVSKLLGHTTLKMTQRYARVADSLKATAVNNLPSILISTDK